MHLSKIRLAGFKTFVDPVTLPFDAPMVGIVGPNGCGKSNVIDAVRWVMGESSPRSLRGEAMSDVIFNGSAARKPVGQASVELIFDNSDGRLGGPYAAFSEIAVKRQVGRDGQSFYFLNGTRCRRRDITDIFLGTGLGPRSYAIIEQGMISRFIEARPEELRLFLEEAAGISRYKERRRETELRLKHTQENLSRVHDLQGELEKHIKHLKRQAQAARRYRRLEEEERLLKVQILALRSRGWEAERRTLEKAMVAQASSLEAQRAELRALESAIEKCRLEHHKRQRIHRDRQEAFYTLSTAIARQEAQFARLKERQVEAQRSLKQITQALDEGRERLQRERARQDRLDERLEEMQQAREAAEAEAGEKEALWQREEEAMGVWEKAWEAFNAERSGPSQALQVERTRLEALDREEQDLKRRRQRLLEEMEEEGEALAPVEEAIEEAERQVKGLEERLSESNRAIKAQRRANGLQAEALEEKRAALSSLKARIASLKALQEDALGALDEGSWKGEQRLVQYLHVEDGWERAVEKVLGPYLQALCLPGPGPHRERLKAFFTDMPHPPWEAQKGGCLPLASRVKAPWPLDSLMAGVYGAEDEEKARQLLPHLASFESVITPEGLWLGPDWIQRGSDDGFLVRERVIKRLMEEAVALQKDVNDVEGKLAEGQRRLEAMEVERESQGKAFHEAQRTLAALEAKHAGLEAQNAERKRHAARAKEEMGELEKRISDIEAERAGARTRLEAAKGAIESLEARRHTLQSQRKTRQRILEAVRREARAATERVHGLAMDIQTLRHEREASQKEQRRLERQMASQEERLKALASTLKEEGPVLARLQAELSQQLGQKQALEREKNQAEAELASLQETLDAKEKARQALSKRIEEQATLLEEGHLELQTLKTRCQAVAEEIREKGFDPQDLVSDLPSDTDEASLKAKLEKVAASLQRLGAVNLAAMEELEQQMARKASLDAQCADVEEAIATLQRVIHTIDKESRERFKATFDRLDRELKTLFPRLFGGGEASLTLTGDSLLDAGVVLMARPPGKRNTSLHLLSGGEKALAAVALIFSLFSLNPAPFCLMDEVDAPLDDANVERFCALVKEMSEHTQFIIATHNKVTMEMVHQLVGVTMQEPGVSRLVAVDVEEALEMAVR